MSGLCVAEATMALAKCAGLMWHLCIRGGWNQPKPVNIPVHFFDDHDRTELGQLGQLGTLIWNFLMQSCFFVMSLQVRNMNVSVKLKRWVGGWARVDVALT